MLAYCQQLRAELAAQGAEDEPVRVLLDDRDIARADKKWQHVKRGVPVSVEIGPRDLAGDTLMPKRRDESAGEKKPAVPRSQFVAEIGATLAAMQQKIFERALAERTANAHDREARRIRGVLHAGRADKPEIHGGFAICHFVESAEDGRDPGQAQGHDPLRAGGR